MKAAEGVVKYALEIRQRARWTEELETAMAALRGELERAKTPNL